MYDIIYSLIIHESIESYRDMIKNIFYFNKHLNIYVVVHCNEFMYNQVKNDKLYNVLINPSFWSKRYLTYDILHAHIENYLYAGLCGIKSRYVINLTSNCMFHKYLFIEDIEKQIINADIYTPSSYFIEPNRKLWVWDKIMNNTKIIDLFLKNNINEIVVNFHEGIIYETYTLNKCINFINENNIRDLIVDDCQFEEFLIQTLYVNIKKQYYGCICRLFYELKDYVPSIIDIKQTSQPIIKRVDRIYDNPIRVWLRQITNNYKGIT